MDDIKNSEDDIKDNQKDEQTMKPVSVATSEDIQIPNIINSTYIDNETFPGMKSKSCLQKLDSIDKYYSGKFHNYIANPYVELIFYIFARLFNPETIAVYTSSILVYSLLKYKHVLLVIKPTIQFLTGLIITLIIKKIIGRPRPNVNPKRLFKVRERESNNSMPSGDTLQSAIWGMIAFIYGDCIFGLLLIPAAMTGRVYFNCHYFGDCIVGGTLGVVSFLLVDMGINAIKIKYNFNI